MKIVLKDIVKQIRGVSFKPEDVEDTPGNFRITLFRANNIENGKLNYQNLYYIPREKVKDDQLIRANDILISASSGSKNAIGKAVRISHDLNATFGAFCKVIRPIKCYSIYLGYYFQSPKYRTYIANTCQGANINNIRSKDIDEITINLPSKDELNKRCKILSNLSDLIDLREKQLHYFDGLIKSRFVEMFGDPINNSKNLPKYQFSNFIEFLTSGSRGWSKYFNEVGKEWFITIKNVKNCHINTANMQLIDAPNNAEAKRTKVRTGDLLISITADLGRTGVVTEKIAKHGAYINQHLTCIRVNKKILNPIYIAYFMESPAGKKQFMSKNQSAVKAGSNFDSIKSLQLLVPSLQQQNQFADFVHRIDKSRMAVQKSLDELEILKKSLLQEYFG